MKCRAPGKAVPNPSAIILFISSSVPDIKESVYPHCEHLPLFTGETSNFKSESPFIVINSH